MIRFELWHKNLLIGILLYDSLNKLFDDKPWSFHYSDEFKNQTHIVPISQFQDINMIYVSENLFPMFKSRIPSPNRPDIMLDRVARGIGDDDISMLIHYGYKCITDPFLLIFKPVE